MSGSDAAPPSGAGGTSGSDAAAPGVGGGTSGNDGAPGGGGGALAAAGGTGGTSVVPGAGPLAPTVTADSPAFTRTPTWMWRPGGGGNGTFRAKLDSPDLSTGATETKNGFFTPPTPLDDGPHKLFVAERDDAGRWSPPGNAEVLVTAGPLSRYTFDNNALDTGLNRNDGVMNGPTPTPDHLGNPNGALQFDGINDGIVTKVAKYGVKTNCTISLWIKTNPAEDGLYFPFAGQMGVMTRFGKETGMYVTHAGGSNSALAPVMPGVWVHLLGTFDGRAINTYINGALAATQMFPGIVDWVPEPAFGNFRGEGMEFWAGALDDVRIYNHVLSAAEIQDIYMGKN